MSGGPALGIVELGEACARQRDANLDLFELLGRWIRDSEDPAEQQLLVVATHRHAWHAELWAARCPSIPPVDLDTPADDAPDPTPPTSGRVEWYRRRVERLQAEAVALADRADPRLDPSTHRTVNLVRADLDELLDLAAAIG